MIRPWVCPTAVCDAEDSNHDHAHPDLTFSRSNLLTFEYNFNNKYYRDFAGNLRFVLRKAVNVTGVLVTNLTFVANYGHFDIGQSRP
jgi:hypothetical protein